MRNLLLRTALFIVALFIFLVIKAAGTDVTIDGNVYIVYENTAVFYQAPKDYKGDFKIPETVTYDGKTFVVNEISYMAFNDCNGITSITIPSSVEVIIEYGQPFEECTELQAIYVDEKNANYVSLDGVLYTKDMKTLIKVPAQKTFYTMPKEVTEFYNAFNGCSKLTYIDVANGNEKYVSKNGALCDKKDYMYVVPGGVISFTLPASIKRWDSAFIYCNELQEIKVESGNTSYISKDGILYSSDMTSLVEFPICSPITEYIVPSTVTAIKSSFGKNLTTITITKNVTTVVGSSFRNCENLEKIYLLCELQSYECLRNTPLDVTVFTWATPESIKNIWAGNVIQIGGSSIITDEEEYLRAVSFRIEDQNVPYFPLNVIEVKNYDTVITPNEDGIYRVAAEPGTKCSFTVNYIIGGEERFLSFDLTTKTPSVSVKVSDRGQTYLDFSVTASSDETMQPREFGVLINSTYYPADEDGNVRVEDLVPNKQYSYSAYAKYDGTIINSEGTQKVRTSGLFPFISSLSVGVTTLKAKGHKTVLDATIEDEYFMVGSIKYPGNGINLTGIAPNTTYTIGYYVVTEGGHFEYEEKKITTEPLELTILNPQPASSTCAIVAAETNIEENEPNVGFQWRKYDAPETLPSSEGYAAIYDGRLEGYIKNLQSTSYYNVRAFYKTADDTYYYSDWITFDPSDFSYFEPTVHTYPIDEVTAATAMVKGYVLAGTDDITAQGFEYWPLGESQAAAKTVSTAQTRAGDGVSVVMATGQVMTAELTNLAPGTTYCCRAFVTTVAGTTYGEEQTFTTPGTPTGVNTVEAEKAEPVIMGYYDLSGRRLNEPQRGGVTIIKYSDGTAKKVLIK